MRGDLQPAEHVEVAEEAAGAQPRVRDPAVGGDHALGRGRGRG